MSSKPDQAPIRRLLLLTEALGKVAAILLLGLVLVLGPMGMIRLNEAWGWPRWRVLAGQVIGGGLIVGAVAVWLYSSSLFSRIGGGTPFVVDPPKRLVTVGLYRYSRNPIYVAHLAFLCGWFLIFGHLTLLLYAAVWSVVIHAVIVRWEEPQLRARFGEDFVRYTRSVPRWLLMWPRSRA